MGKSVSITFTAGKQKLLWVPKIASSVQETGYRVMEELRTWWSKPDISNIGKPLPIIKAKRRNCIKGARGQGYLAGSGSVAGRHCSHRWRQLPPEMWSKQSERKRNILASPYRLVSHTDLLPVPRVNLPMTLSITLGVTGRDLRANSPQACKETNVVALLRIRNYSSLHLGWTILDSLNNYYCPVRRRASGSMCKIDLQ